MSEETHPGAGRMADHARVVADSTTARDRETACIRDETVRLECLKLAVAHAGPSEGYGSVVGGARSFYEFTQGSPPGGDLAPPAA